jgi:uncharacterized protein (DUF433 family)
MRYMSKPTSFRLPDAVDARLDQYAREAGESRTALAVRYIDEGLRTDQHPLIAFVTHPTGRRAMVAGTRLEVADVIETVRASGNSVEEAADYLDLPPAKVQAAVRYYAEFAEEIDAWLERRREIADRHEALWRKEQAALA